MLTEVKSFISSTLLVELWIKQYHKSRIQWIKEHWQECVISNKASKRWKGFVAKRLEFLSKFKYKYKCYAVISHWVRQNHTCN